LGNAHVAFSAEVNFTTKSMKSTKGHQDEFCQRRDTKLQDPAARFARYVFFVLFVLFVLFVVNLLCGSAPPREK
jgi:hypothetical protein